MELRRVSSFLFESERCVLRAPIEGEVACFLLYRGKIGLQRSSIRVLNNMVDPFLYMPEAVFENPERVV